MKKILDFLKPYKPYKTIVIFLLFIIETLFFFYLLTKKNKVEKQIDLNEKLNKENNEYQIILNKRSNELETQTRIFSQQIESNLKKENLIEKLLIEAKKKLFQISGMTNEEASQQLFNNAKKNLKDELNNLALIQIKSFKQNLSNKITNIICSSLERYSSEIAFSKTVDYLVVDNKKTISRIIGRDGRNITIFRKLTGTDIIIDKDKGEKRKTTETVIEISSFDSLRREIALQSLKKLIANEQKITPIYIEKSFNEASLEINSSIIQTGESVLEELKITDINNDLISYIGRLKYRTSYGQNVLEHCLEVAKISGTIAAEIDLDPLIAKRAGLLHDIGKSTEDLTGSSHITSGVMLAKRYNESEIVVNAIASHHDRSLANNPYSLIIAAADTLSAARPGSRSNQLESYLKRMKSLEKIAENFEEVKKIYSFQAGREIWIIVDSDKANDFDCIELTKKIKKMIQEKVIIPGDITISLIREKKIVEKIVNSGRFLKQ